MSWMFLFFYVSILDFIPIVVIFRAVDKVNMRVGRTCAAWAAGMLSDAAVVSASKRLGRLRLWTQTSFTASLDGA